MGLGDLNSNEKGTGARFNDGKPPYELIALAAMTDALLQAASTNSQQAVVSAVRSLGRFQAGGDAQDLSDCLYWTGAAVGLDAAGMMAETAKVLEYGKNKYSKRGDCTCSAGNASLDLSRGLAAGLREHSPTCGVMEIEHGGDWNWAKGMSWQSVIACAARHLVGTPDNPGMLKDPKGIDPESGCLHAGHVGCNIMFLLQFMLTYREGDDRPKQIETPPF